jgi:hypothetical protein
MLGELIKNLDRPDVAASLLATLDPIIAATIAERAAATASTPPDFMAKTVRDFVERADDDRWFQLVTIIRKAEDPGLAAVHTILKWAVAGS